MEQSLNLISEDVESSEMTPEEVKELNTFINDYGKENIIDTIENSQDQNNENISDSEYLAELNIKTQHLIEKEENNQDTQSEEKEILISEKATTKKSKKIDKAKSKKYTSRSKISENQSIEFLVVNDDGSDQNNSKYTDSESKVISINSKDEMLDFNNLEEKPEKIFFKIPKSERYLILVLNDKEELTSHIYGRYKLDKNPKYKVLLSNPKGSWHIKLQLLESGETFDLSFKV